ncbi:hypothetical protein QQF64_023858 [Cirrhinus molitorella]|uniref:Uncharacterized protein n=1 Tax=Cirrhinus molitorella TaxID=172907 RepID=A0ABR3NJJ9_9TELE
MTSGSSSVMSGLFISFGHAPLPSSVLLLLAAVLLALAAMLLLPLVVWLALLAASLALVTVLPVFLEESSRGQGLLSELVTQPWDSDDTVAVHV